MSRSYQSVLDGIEEDLAAGRLVAGGKLPGERALAERYDVSRASVREAVRVLETLGVIRSSTGSGPGAGTSVIAAPEAPIGAALRWHLVTGRLPMTDLVNARVLIEAWSASTAANDPDPAALARAEALLDLMDETADPATFLDLDTRFHQGVAELSDNAVVAAIMAGMATSIQDRLVAAASSTKGWARVVTQLRTEHRAILAAVTDGDSDAAASAAAGHIYAFYRSLGISE